MAGVLFLWNSPRETVADVPFSKSLGNASEWSCNNDGKELSANTGVMMCEELKPGYRSQHTECHRSEGSDQDRSQSHVVN